eukprot:6991379-Alexandrium_andersonii.AAC.1
MHAAHIHSDTQRRRADADTPSTRHATRQTDAHQTQTLIGASNILIILNDCFYLRRWVASICQTLSDA